MASENAKVEFNAILHNSTEDNFITNIIYFYKKYFLPTGEEVNCINLCSLFANRKHKNNIDQIIELCNLLHSLDKNKNNIPKYDLLNKFNINNDAIRNYIVSQIKKINNENFIYITNLFSFLPNGVSLLLSSDNISNTENLKKLNDSDKIKFINTYTKAFFGENVQDHLSIVKFINELLSLLEVSIQTKITEECLLEECLLEEGLLKEETKEETNKIKIWVGKNSQIEVNENAIKLIGGEVYLGKVKVGELGALTYTAVENPDPVATTTTTLATDTTPDVKNIGSKISAKSEKITSNLIPKKEKPQIQGYKYHTDDLFSKTIEDLKKIEKQLKTLELKEQEEKNKMTNKSAGNWFAEQAKNGVYQGLARVSVENLAKAIIFGLKKSEGLDDVSLAIIENFLKSKLGNAMLSGLVATGVHFAPIDNIQGNEHIQNVANKCLENATSDGVQELAGFAMEYVIPSITEAIKPLLEASKETSATQLFGTMQKARVATPAVQTHNDEEDLAVVTDLADAKEAKKQQHRK